MYSLFLRTSFTVPSRTSTSKQQATQCTKPHCKTAKALPWSWECWDNQSIIPESSSEPNWESLEEQSYKRNHTSMRKFFQENTLLILFFESCNNQQLSLNIFIKQTNKHYSDDYSALIGVFFWNSSLFRPDLSSHCERWRPPINWPCVVGHRQRDDAMLYILLPVICRSSWSILKLWLNFVLVSQRYRSINSSIIKQKACSLSHQDYLSTPLRVER